MAEHARDQIRARTRRGSASSLRSGRRRRDDAGGSGKAEGPLTQLLRPLLGGHDRGDGREAGRRRDDLLLQPEHPPAREYELRKRENEEYAKRLGVPFVDGDYDPDEWYKRARGMEFSLERGSRCTMCFDMRMDGRRCTRIEWDFSRTSLRPIVLLAGRTRSKWMILGDGRLRSMG